MNQKPPDFPTVSTVFSVKIMVDCPRRLKDDGTVLPMYRSAAERLQCRCAACKPSIPLIPTNIITVLVQRKRVLIQLYPLSFRWTAVVLSVDPSQSRCVTRLIKNRDVVFVKSFSDIPAM